MRTNRLIAGVAVCALASAALGSRSAIADNDLGTTQTVSVAVQLPGFQTPAEVSGGSGDPCAGYEPYTEFYSARDDRFVRQDEVTFYVPMAGQPPPGPLYADMPAEGSWQEWQPATAVVAPTHVRYTTACRDPITLLVEYLSLRAVWVPLVTQEVVVASLSQRLEDLLEAPALSWPSMDREFGWLYVKAPMDFRIVPIEAVSLTATVTNLTGSVTATVSATPISVRFESGEPGGAAVTCSIASATAGYLTSSPGQCAYTYQNSSAIGAGGEFGWRATLLWQVTTSSPQFPPRVLPTVSYGTVAVAEAQAVVTG